jgi:hypothetical protein
MTSKLFNNLLLFSLFGIAMWFFGNLYEAIVIGPNMLSDTAARMEHWQKFFAVTNPVFFYVPFPQLATIVLIILFFNTSGQKTELKKSLKLANIFQIASIVLSVYMITQINLKLFFGDLEKYSDKLSSMALLWNILNAVRVVLVGFALTFVFKAYLQTQKNVN